MKGSKSFFDKRQLAADAGVDIPLPGFHKTISAPHGGVRLKY
jgi:glycine cleavage system protein P-like pyridoxal-binding family